MAQDLEYEIIAFKTQQAWEGWLEQNYDKQNGIYLKMYKKDSGVSTVSSAGRKNF